MFDNQHLKLPGRVPIGSHNPFSRLTPNGRPQRGPSHTHSEETTNRMRANAHSSLVVANETCICNNMYICISSTAADKAS
jgi:hypothetical protein